MRWYYAKKSQPLMYCDLCVHDDQFQMITSIEYVAKMPQTVRCYFCDWCPKEDGLTRPISKKSEYVSKVNFWSALRGEYPDKRKE